MPTLPVELDDILANICSKFSGGRGQNTQVVCYKDQSIAACQEWGYGSHRKMHCKAMGCHPKNRDGQGIHLKKGSLAHLENRAGGLL